MLIKRKSGVFAKITPKIAHSTAGSIKKAFTVNSKENVRLEKIFQSFLKRKNFISALKNEGLLEKTYQSIRRRHEQELKLAKKNDI